MSTEPATARQEGGSHYKDMAIQPIEFIQANGLGFCEGNVVKYVSRWRAKGGVEDLRKARHYLDLLIEHEAPLPVELPANVAVAKRGCTWCSGIGVVMSAGGGDQVCPYCKGSGIAP